MVHKQLEGLQMIKSTSKSAPDTHGTTILPRNNGHLAVFPLNTCPKPKW